MNFLHLQEFAVEPPEQPAPALGTEIECEIVVSSRHGGRFSDRTHSAKGSAPERLLMIRAGTDADKRATECTLIESESTSATAQFTGAAEKRWLFSKSPIESVTPSLPCATMSYAVTAE
jgi:hypothetical protein